MTVKEFYEWCVKHNCENLELRRSNDEGDYHIIVVPECIGITDKEVIIY